ncbi:MAG: glycosyltransferase family 2 protein [Terrimicrobiaceae bacterium]|nr:glycosyltransferase family 2 protein [Terrimicrobiaceae bacterium]
MPDPSATHLVLLPSYNSGKMLARVASEVAARWLPVWIVIDASTDASARLLDPLLACNPFVRRIVLVENSGKGGAVLAGLRAAGAEGFTHALVMDADGQHAVDAIAPFLARSKREPDAMILGVPIFGDDAPPERVKGRRVGNWWANLATLWGGIDDSLFGFRVYPVRESIEILDSIRTARRFDFDTELAVRLYWRGVRPINIPVPVCYPSRDAGGVTHFHYVRDNLLLVAAHTRLFFGMLARLPRLLAMRRRRP